MFRLEEGAKSGWERGPVAGGLGDRRKGGYDLYPQSVHLWAKRPERRKYSGQLSDVT